MQESPKFLRSPFNGEVIPVPEDIRPETLEAMIAGGFTPEPEQEDSQPRKRKEPK